MLTDLVKLLPKAAKTKCPCLYVNLTEIYFVAARYVDGKGIIEIQIPEASAFISFLPGEESAVKAAARAIIKATNNAQRKRL